MSLTVVFLAFLVHVSHISDNRSLLIYGKVSEIAKFLAWGIVNAYSGCDVQLLMENVVDDS